MARKNFSYLFYFFNHPLAKKYPNISKLFGKIMICFALIWINYSKTASSFRPKRRLSIVLIAAILSLFLLGAGVVAAIYGDSIQNWFEYHWERMTGQTMSEAHGAVIEHLSQEIGVRQTVGETTVTVDSATVGDDILYLLLRVERQELNRRHTYNFENFHMEVTPDPLEDAAGMGGIGLKFYDMDGDGAALFLMEFEYGSREGFEPDTSPLEVMVELENLLRTGNRDKILEEGKWTLTFTLDRSKLPETIALPDTEVTALNPYDEFLTAKHTNIVLTNTGIRFLCELKDTMPENHIDYGGWVEAPAHIAEVTGKQLVTQMYVVLESGAIVEDGGGTGIFLKDSNQLSCSFHWNIPINLDEVVAIQIGQTQIPVP